MNKESVDSPHPSDQLIVVVDDNRVFEFHVDVYLRTSAEALDFLRRAHADGTAVTELWLDHDLGLLADGTSDTIRPVANWLEERAVWDDPVQVEQLFVHSVNPTSDEVAKSLAKFYPVTRTALPACHQID